MGGVLCIYVTKAWCTDTTVIKSPCPVIVYIPCCDCSLYPPDADAGNERPELPLTNNRLLIPRWVPSTTPTWRLCSPNSTNMSPVPLEETGHWTMSTPTWLMHSKPPHPPWTIQPLLVVPPSQLLTQTYKVYREQTLYFSKILNPLTGVCLPLRPNSTPRRILTHTPPLFWTGSPLTSTPSNKLLHSLIRIHEWTERSESCWRHATLPSDQCSGLWFIQR